MPTTRSWIGWRPRAVLACIAMMSLAATAGAGEMTVGDRLLRFASANGADLAGSTAGIRLAPQASGDRAALAVLLDRLEGTPDRFVEQSGDCWALLSSPEQEGIWLRGWRGSWSIQGWDRAEIGSLLRLLDKLRTVATALDTYTVDHGRPPATLAAAGVSGATDPWGEPLVLVPRPDGYVLRSSGPDRIAGSCDDWASDTGTLHGPELSADCP